MIKSRTKNLGFIEAIKELKDISITTAYGWNVNTASRQNGTARRRMTLCLSKAE